MCFQVWWHSWVSGRPCCDEPMITFWVWSVFFNCGDTVLVTVCFILEKWCVACRAEIRKVPASRISWTNFRMFPRLLHTTATNRRDFFWRTMKNWWDMLGLMTMDGGRRKNWDAWRTPRVTSECSNREEKHGWHEKEVRVGDARFSHTQIRKSGDDARKSLYILYTGDTFLTSKACKDLSARKCEVVCL